MARLKFTIICEFLGGTYVAQVPADDVSGAVVAWADYLLKDQPVPECSAEMAEAVLAELDDDPPMPLKSLTGVWCITASCGGDLMLANIVATALPEGGAL